MRRISGLQIKNHQATGRVEKLVLDIPKLMKNPLLSEAVENLIDILAVQAINERNETGRPWEDVKKELGIKDVIKTHSVQNNNSKNARKVFKKTLRQNS